MRSTIAAHYQKQCLLKQQVHFDQQHSCFPSAMLSPVLVNWPTAVGSMLYCNGSTWHGKLHALSHTAGPLTIDISLSMLLCRAHQYASLLYHQGCTKVQVLMLMTCTSGVGHTTCLELTTSQSCATSSSSRSLLTGWQLICCNSILRYQRMTVLQSLCHSPLTLPVCTSIT